MGPRLLALLAFAFVLYVAATLASTSVHFGLALTTLAISAGGSALTAVWLTRSSRATPATRAVARLAVALSLALAARLSLRTHHLLAELLTAIALPGVGLELVRLARDLPDRPRALQKRGALFAGLGLVAASSAAAGIAAAAPPVWLFGRSLIAPPMWARAPGLSLAALASVAFALRVARRLLGSDARALSANLWGAMGLGSALALLGFDAFATALGHGAPELAGPIAAALCLSGHALMAAPRSAEIASASARKLLALLLAAACAAVLAWALGRVPGADVRALFLALVLAFVCVYLGASRAVERLLAPGRGALLAALAEIRRSVYGALDFQEFAGRVLKPVRRAAAVPEAAPWLATFDPARIAQLDAAGIARTQARALPAPLVAYLERHASEVLVVDQLRALLPRRPDLVRVVAVLDELGAVCAVPLRHESTLEGALIVARGTRSSPLTLEELLELERVGELLAPIAASFSSLERMRARAETAEHALRELALGYEQRGHEIAELRAQLSALKAGLGSPPPEREAVHYSPAMRELLHRLEISSVQELPLLLHGETGLGYAALARIVHRASGREREPFIVIDCANADREAIAAQLFGIGEGASAKPGVLELAGAGTLVLLELPALPRSAQEQLVEVLEERRIRGVGGASAAFAGRVIATARASAEELAAKDALAAPLASWFLRTSYRVPPLRERPEDFESSLLLALDRAARTLGTKAKGIDAEALRVLLGYDWPGNEAELTSVIERAFRRAKGPRLLLDDVLVGAADALGAGTFREQERAIVLRALRRAGGNRARAARALGMKRAELLEKLRELELDRPTQN